MKQAAASVNWTPDQPMVSIKDVHKSFGELEVLSGVSMDIMKGECICIIGPSGSGKSALIRCINESHTTARTSDEAARSVRPVEIRFDDATQPLLLLGVETGAVVQQPTFRRDDIERRYSTQLIWNRDRVAAQQHRIGIALSTNESHRIGVGGISTIDRKDGDAFVGVLVVQRLNCRHGLSAESTPRCPEVQHHQFAAIVRE